MKKSFYDILLNCGFILLAVLITPWISIAAQPGVDLRGWGATTYTVDSNNPYTAIESWIKIVDYDGIANDGSSHTVTVTYPDTSTHSLYFRYKADSTSAYYERTDYTIPTPFNAADYSGTYRFQVVDPTGAWSKVTDHVVANPIDPPVEAGFLPNFSAVETLTAHFDDIYVNSQLWDDFESGYDPLKWKSLPSGATYESGEVGLQKTYATPAGPLWFHLDNVPALNTFKATVRPDAINGYSSRARIAAVFWNDGQEDVQCHLRIHQNLANLKISKDYLLDGHMAIEDILGPITLGPTTQGNNYELSMQWDGSSITFRVLGLDDSVDYSFTHTPPTANPVITPKARIGIVRHLVLADTGLDLSWSPVSGAAGYRIKVYAYNQSWKRETIFSGYTGETSYTVPPGILKPNGYYAYRIDAVRDHLWVDDDNRSVSDPRLQLIITGPIQNQAPLADLWNIGAETWSNNAYGGHTFTSYYAKIHDAQGIPDNIESVSVRLTDGTTELNLYRDENESATSALYRGHYFGPVQSGDHLFTVLDRDGHTYTVTETLTPDPIAPPVEATFSPSNNSVAGGTALSFDWADVPGAALYQLIIYDKHLDQILDFKTTESEFALAPGLLEENSYYHYRVYARREPFENNTDNGSSEPFAYELAPSFFTTQTSGMTAPVLNTDSFGIAVWHAPDPGTGAPVYGLQFWAKVDDPDGVPENIQRVEVTYPDGVTKQVLNYLSAEPFGSNYFHMAYYSDPSMIREGTYRFRVVDFDGHQGPEATDTLTNVAANILPWPVNESPVNDAVLADTAPEISWDPVAEASYYRVRIWGSWLGEDAYWSNPTQAAQFKVPAGILDPDTVYTYRLYAYREAPDSNVDFYACNNAWKTVSNHFKTGARVEDLPALAGNFGRTDCTSACTGNSDADNDIDGADLALFPIIE